MMADKPRRRIAGEKSIADQAKEATPTPARKKPLVKRPARPSAPHKPGVPKESEPDVDSGLVTEAPAEEKLAAGTTVESDESDPPAEPAVEDAPSVLGATRSASPDEERAEQDLPAHDYRRSPWLYPAIVGAAVLLIGGIAMAAWSWNTQRAIDTRESREQEAVTAAVSATEALFDFSHATGEEFLAAVEPLVTDSVREHQVFRGYADTVAQRIDTEQYVGVTSPISAAATECGQSCRDGEVEVLVAFTYVGQSPLVGFDTPVEYQFLFTMSRGDGEWLVDEIVHLNQADPVEQPAPEDVAPEDVAPEDVAPEDDLEDLDPESDSSDD